MPRPTVPDAARAAAKYVRRAGQATTDYTEGVERSPKDQAALAVAAKPLFVAQVTAKETHDRWERNIKRSGNEGFKKGVRDKGAARYGPGVGAAEGKYAANIAASFGVIAATEIPAKGLPASDANFQRSRLIGQALNKLRMTAGR
jgi:hypothetical protein